MPRHLTLPCIAALALGAATAASAQTPGITLFGDARLGLGYNIRNNGQPALVATREQSVVVGVDPATGADVTEDVVTVLGGTNDFRAVSRVRFGVIMVGESDSGINFGATIRADNSAAGEGGTRGQRAGNVFVTGNWGTLTFGDTSGADQSRVANPTENVSLTGLGDFDELPFLSNGGGADNDALQFLAHPDDRPTVRYDYDFGNLGLSLSTNSNLDSVGAGASYTLVLDRGEVSAGLGYYDFTEFTSNVRDYGLVLVPDGHQWSASVTGTYDWLEAGVGYASIRAGDLGELDVLAVGAGAVLGEFRVYGYYTSVIDGDKEFGEAFDGRDSYGVTLSYALGGGITLRTGVARTYGADAVGTRGGDFAPAVDSETIADFGLGMNF